MQAAKKEKEKELENVVSVSQHHTVEWVDLEVYLYPGKTRNGDGGPNPKDPPVGFGDHAGAQHKGLSPPLDPAAKHICLQKTSGTLSISRTFPCTRRFNLTAS
jgi:hypothetical protein